MRSQHPHRVIVITASGATRYDGHIGTCGERIDQLAFDNDAAIAFDQRPQHWPVAVDRRTGSCGRSDHQAHQRSADHRQASAAGCRQYAEVVRRQSGSSSHQHGAGLQQPPPALEIGAGSDRLDEHDATWAFGLHMIERHDRVCAGRQRFPSLNSYGA